jgi:hypothetical protein
VLSYAKNATIVIGTALGAAWTIANVVGLYYAKVYLFDQPALTLSLRAEQMGLAEEPRQIVVTVSFDNHGIRPYEIPIKDVRPITIARVTRSERDEAAYEIIRQVSLPGVFPGDGTLPMHVRDMRELVFDPGEKGSFSTLAFVPAPGLYFVEFSVEAPYRSLFLDYILRRPAEPIWILANAYVHVK